MTRFSKRKFNFNFSVAPQDTACPLRELQAPIGTKQFTFLCYTVSNPEANVTWLANDEEPRQGISVQNTVSQSAFLDTARKRSCEKILSTMLVNSYTFLLLSPDPSCSTVEKPLVDVPDLDSIICRMISMQILDGLHCSIPT